MSEYFNKLLLKHDEHYKRGNRFADETHDNKTLNRATYNVAAATYEHTLANQFLLLAILEELKSGNRR